MNNKAYKAFYKMQERKLEYQVKRSEYRHKGDKETASEYGEKAVIVGECMSILKKTFGLTFE